jgi:hypothetical protein
MRARLLAVSLLLILAVSLPYFLAARAEGEYVFGGLLLNPLDGNSYFAKMQQGWRGETQFTLPFTAEPGEGVYLFVFYLFLGHLARWLGLSVMMMFHLARLFGVIVLLLALYLFLQSSLPDKRTVGFSFTLAILGSGLGWIAALFGGFTADFWVAETYPFLSAYANPHFPLGLALLLFLFTFLQDGWRLPGWFAAPLAFLLALVAPFGVVVALAILSVLLAWDITEALVLRRWVAARPRLAQTDHQNFWRSADQTWRLARRLFWIVLGGAPVLFYDFWVANTNPILAGWNAQNVTPAPPLWDILVSLSPALIVALLGAWGVIRQNERRARLLVVWLGTGLLLVLLPFSLQRRFMMGLYLPVAALAGYFLHWLEFVRQPPLKGTRLLAVVILVFSLLTNQMVLLAARYGALTHDSLLYLTRAEYQALRWIDSRVPRGALVLASPELGMFIPAHSGARVIYGHPFETVNADENQAAILTFFQGCDNCAANQYQESFLIEHAIDFVFYGPREQALGSLAADLTGARTEGLPAALLRPVFSSDRVTIYEVIPP